MGDQMLKELMVADVLIAHLADSMETVFAKISARPEQFVVILDEENVPLHLTTGREMKSKMPRSLDWPQVRDLSARLPEALLVDQDVTLSRAMIFFNILSDSTPQPPGLVVMRADQVAGVLSYDVLSDYFQTELVLESQTKDGGIVRGGVPQTIADAVFQCRRYPRCSFESSAAMIDEPPLCGAQPAHGRTRLKA